MELLFDLYNQSHAQFAFLVIVYHLIWLYFVVKLTAFKMGRSFKTAVEEFRKQFQHIIHERDDEIARLKRNI